MFQGSESEYPAEAAFVSLFVVVVASKLAKFFLNVGRLLLAAFGQ